MRKIRLLIVYMLIIAAVSAQAGTLIISQYYEGTSNNKWIELYNADTNAIDLGAAGYRLGLWSNANREGWKSNSAPTANNALTGTVAASTAYLIGYTTATNPAYAQADFVSASLNFNGDDSVVLYTGTSYDFTNVVDVFGVITNTTYADRSLVRTNMLTTGVNTDFSEAEWMEYALAAVDAAVTGVNERLGYHLAEGGIPPAPVTNVRFTASSAVVEENAGTYDVIVIKTLPQGTVSGEITLSGTAAEGGAADYTVSTNLFTLDGATTSATITITINDDVGQEGDETVILTLTNVTGGSLVSPSEFTLTISGNDFPPSLLIISEVADPADNASARFVELFNASGAPIDLGSESWYLSKQTGDSSLWTDVALTGTVAAGDTYLVAGNADDFNTAYGFYPEQASATVVVGNGDDVYALFKGGNHLAGTPADIYGEEDVDGNGQLWYYADSQAERLPAVTQGNLAWTNTEWDITYPSLASDMTPGIHGGNVTSMSFAVSAMSLSESGGACTVRVTRSHGAGTASAELLLSGTAAEGGAADFIISTDRVDFAEFAVSVEIVIQVNDDVIIDDYAQETVILKLTNATGAVLVMPTTFTLTIIDNDRPASQILISEIMMNPTASVDASGEWFELYNKSGSDIDINGWIIEDADSDRHVIDNGGPLLVPAGGFLVLGNSTDTNLNGNAPVDYQYAGVALGNTVADEIILLNAATVEVTRVEYSELDMWVFPAGASLYLTGPDEGQNIAANWQVSSVPWPGSAGDSGSPGAANEQWGAAVQPDFTGVTLDAGLGLMVFNYTNEPAATYSIERATDLMLNPAFTDTVATGVSGVYTQDISGHGANSLYRMKKE